MSLLPPATQSQPLPLGWDLDVVAHVIDRRDAELAQGTNWLDVGDINGDGRDDLAVLSISAEVRLYMQDASGQLVAGHRYPIPGDPMGNPPLGIKLADLDGDGRKDAVVTTGRYVAPLMSQGQTMAWGQTLPLSLEPVAPFVAGDFNGDGHLDLFGHTGLSAVESRRAGHFLLFRGTGSGTFHSPIEMASGNNLVEYFATDDLDGDGSVDVAALRRAALGSNVAELALYFNDGNGALSAPTRLADALWSTVVVVDHDGDGRNDVVATRMQDILVDADQVEVFRNLGGRQFASSPESMFSWPAVTDVVTGDFDGNGRTDLLFGNDGQDMLSAYLADPGGPRHSDPLMFAGRGFRIGRGAMAVGDLNSDGIPDAAVAVQVWGFLVLHGSHAMAVPGTLPGPPRILAVTIDHATKSARVAFAPPQSSGSEPITHYTVHSVPEGAYSSPLHNTELEQQAIRLTNDEKYRFVVRAHSAVGAGPPSAPSDQYHVYYPPLAVAGEAQAFEGTLDAGRMRFHVSLRYPALSGGARVRASTVDGSARAGVDYVAIEQELSFAHGEIETWIEVPLIPNAVQDGERTFRLRITPISGAEPLVTEATGRILDDDMLQPVHSAAWWDPSESGWGLMTYDQGTAIGIGWFTYDHDGEPTWFTGAVLPVGDHRYSGTLHRFLGVPYAAQPGVATRESASFADATLSFNGSTGLEFQYRLHDGSGQTRQLQRFPFGELGLFCWPQPAGTAAAANLTDIWWEGPTGSGWGFFAYHFRDGLFGTLYTYDVDGEAVFLVAGLSRQPDGSFSGPLSRQRDGTPLTRIDGQPPSPGSDTVGTARFTPHANGSATLAFQVDGYSVTRTVARMQFGTQRSACGEGDVPVTSAPAGAR